MSFSCSCVLSGARYHRRRHSGHRRRRDTAVCAARGLPQEVRRRALDSVLRAVCVRVCHTYVEAIVVRHYQEAAGAELRTRNFWPIDHWTRVCRGGSAQVTYVRAFIGCSL